MMRLTSWLAPKLATIWKAVTALPVNLRAVVFAVACWLLYSGVRDSFSTPAAKIVLGAVFLVGILWPDRPKKDQP
jgi:hypothetical protein